MGVVVRFVKNQDLNDDSDDDDDEDDDDDDDDDNDDKEEDIDASDSQEKESGSRLRKSTSFGSVLVQRSLPSNCRTRIWRQIGQELCFCSHTSMQLRWKTCLHARVEIHRCASFLRLID